MKRLEILSPDHPPLEETEDLQTNALLTSRETSEGAREKRKARPTQAGVYVSVQPPNYWVTNSKRL